MSSLLKNITKYVLPLIATLAFGYNALANDNSEDNLKQNNWEVEFSLSGSATGYTQLTDGFTFGPEMSENGNITDLVVESEFLRSKLFAGEITFALSEDYAFDDLFKDYEFEVDNNGLNHNVYNKFEMGLQGNLEARAFLAVKNHNTNAVLSLEAGKYASTTYNVSGELGMDLDLLENPEDATWQNLYLSFGLGSFLPSDYTQFGSFVTDGEAYLNYNDWGEDKEGHTFCFMAEKDGIKGGFRINDGSFTRGSLQQRWVLGLNIEGDAFNPELEVPFEETYNSLTLEGNYFEIIGLYGFENEFWNVMLEAGVGIERFDMEHYSYSKSTDYEIGWNELGFDLFNDSDSYYMPSDDMVFDYIENLMNEHGLFMVNAERKLPIAGIMMLPYFGMGFEGAHAGMTLSFDKFVANLNYDSKENFDGDLVLVLGGDSDVVVNMLQDERFARYTYSPISRSALTDHKLRNYYSQIHQPGNQASAVVRVHFEADKADVALAFAGPEVFFEIMAGFSKNGGFSENYGALTFGGPHVLVRTGMSVGRDEEFYADTENLTFDLGFALGKNFTVYTKSGVASVEDEKEGMVGLGLQGKF
ncbi:MAG: hypothetical protein ABIF40_01980 [archaeon]